jgi:hypothetical protein
MPAPMLLALLFVLQTAVTGQPAAAQDAMSAAPQQGSANGHPSSEEGLDGVSLDRALYLPAPDAADVILTPGSYRMAAASNASTLQLFPAGDGRALVVQAIPIQHKQQVAGPVALSIPDREATHHLVLLLPGGQGLDAVGSYDAVRTRGWNPAPALMDWIEQAFAEKEKPIRKPEKKGGH